MRVRLRNSQKLARLSPEKAAHHIHARQRQHGTVQLDAPDTTPIVPCCPSPARPGSRLMIGASKQGGG